MTPDRVVRLFLTSFIFLVWFVNGMICKVLNLVPRHQQIVSEILGGEHAWLLTKVIGCAEIIMAVWILSGISRRFCAICQMTIVASMNVLEFMLTPHLLLFGRWNLLFAFIFIGIIYVHEFVIGRRKTFIVMK